MRPMEEKLEAAGRRRAVLILCVAAGLMMAACGQRRLNVMYTENQTLVAVGYSAERSRSILGANSEAQEYCEREGQRVRFIKQDTTYQGQYDEDVTAAARTAGRVAGALGSQETANASRALSSSTDYKTTFEFLCQ